MRLTGGPRNPVEPSVSFVAFVSLGGDSLLRGANPRRSKFLDALPVSVGGVYRALRVNDDAVDPVEFAGAPALLAPGREDPAVLQLELVDALVLVIGDPPDAVGPLARDVDVPRIPVVADVAEV